MENIENTEKKGETRRKRLTQACELCRRKKIKCDGIKPECHNCRRFKTVCTYTTSLKKRGPRQGYIELLEQRLAKMEKILLSSETMPPETSGPSLSPIETQPASRKRSKTVNEDNNQRRTSSPISYSSTTSSFPATPPCILAPQTESILPTMDVIEHITDLYFDFLYPHYPLFDEASLRRDIREKKCPDFLVLCLLAACARFSERPDIQKNPPWSAGECYAEKARTLLLKAFDEPSLQSIQGIILLTLHEFGCGRGPRSWMYGGAATRMAIEVGIHENKEAENANPTFEKLIEQETLRKVFWCAFTMDKFCTAATGRPSALYEPFCTALLPAKVSGCQGKQYYTESLTGNQYLLLNISCVRKSQLLGNFVDNSCPEQPTGQKPSLDAYAYLVRAANILGEVTVFVNRKEKFSTNIPPYHPNSEVMKLDRMIDNWERDLPCNLKNTPENFESKNNENQQSVLIMLHTLHNTLILLLHRPAMAVADTLDSDIVLPELKSFITMSLAKCMEAVDNVTVLVNKIKLRKDIIPPFLTYLVYTVATVVVSISFSPKEEESKKAKKALPAYMKFLVVARGYWAMADKLYFMIRDLYTIHDKILKGYKEPEEQPTPELYQQSPSNLYQQPVPELLVDTPGPLVPPVPTTTTTNINDWNLPYYTNAMSDNAPDLGFYDELNNPLNYSSLLELNDSTDVQMPGGFNIGFPYFSNPPGQNNE